MKTKNVIILFGKGQGYELMAPVLKALGFEWRGYGPSPSGVEVVYVSKDGDLTYSTLSYFESEKHEYSGREIIDLRSMFHTTTKEITLTDEYNATVDYAAKEVVVGCQHIPFAKVEELAALLKS